MSRFRHRFKVRNFSFMMNILFNDDDVLWLNDIWYDLQEKNANSWAWFVSCSYRIKHQILWMLHLQSTHAHQFNNCVLYSWPIYNLSITGVNCSVGHSCICSPSWWPHRWLPLQLWTVQVTPRWFPASGSWAPIAFQPWRHLLLHGYSWTTCSHWKEKKSVAKCYTTNEFPLCW